MSIAFLDVAYRDGGARAACVVADTWESAVPAATYTSDIESVEEYIPGKFYQRELPCLLSVLSQVPETPALLVVDGYVWLPPNGSPGLGAHLHEALGLRAQVVGIAKTAFSGVPECAKVAKVYRGKSKNPLYVTAIGIELALACTAVSSMAGEHRIPDLLRIVDHLSRMR